jgi:mRNA interferase HigB
LIKPAHIEHAQAHVARVGFVASAKLPLTNLLQISRHGSIVCYNMGGGSMRIISKKAIVEFCENNKRADAPSATRQFMAWHSEAKAAKWTKFADIKARFNSADSVRGGRVVFDIAGNKYRMVVKVKYEPNGLIWIRFIGTHAEYDKIDVETV